MRYVLTLGVIIITAIFIRTAPPTIYMGDGGETVAAAYTLGISHPPGYPVYTLVLKIFSLIPAGDIAFRANLAAVFSGVLVFLLFYALALCLMAPPVQKTFYARAAALCLSFAYVLSTSFWFEAVHAKGGTYALMHACSLASLLYLAKFINEKKNKYFYAASYFAGFLIPLHISAALLVLFITGALAWNRKKTKRLNTAAALFLFLLALVTPYLYTFIRARAGPVVHWGGVTGVMDVVRHALRIPYMAHTEAPFTLNSGLIKLRQYALRSVMEYNIWIVFFISGCYGLFKKNKALLAMAFSFFTLNIAAILMFTGNDVYSPVYIYTNRVFYLLGNMLALIISAYGLYALLCAFKKGSLAPRLIATAMLLLPAAMCVFTFQYNDQSKKFLGYDHGMNILKTLKPGEVFLSGSDAPVFNIAYLKYVKAMFNGIGLYDTNANFFDISVFKPYRGKMTGEIMRGLAAEAAAQNAGRVYSADFIPYPEKNLKPEPAGIIYRLVDMSAPQVYSGAYMGLYTMRDYFNNKKFDVAYREVLARYFIAYAKYAAAKDDYRVFENYRLMAERTAGDVPGVISSIASIYFFEFKDLDMSLKYLERSVMMDPYNFPALKLLIHLYTSFNPKAAIYWLEINNKWEWDREKKAEIAREIEGLKGSIK